VYTRLTTETYSSALQIKPLVYNKSSQSTKLTNTKLALLGYETSYVMSMPPISKTTVLYMSNLWSMRLALNQLNRLNTLKTIVA